MWGFTTRGFTARGGEAPWWFTTRVIGGEAPGGFTSNIGGSEAPGFTANVATF